MDNVIPTPANTFRRLLQIDVSKHVEKNGQFTYLSWPFAVAQLRQADTTAAWEVDDTGSDVNELLDYFGYESLQTILKADMNRVMRALESKRRAA